jgi:hypothetical protein
MESEQKSLNNDIDEYKNKNLIRLNLNDINALLPKYKEKNQNPETDSDKTITENDSEIEKENKIIKKFNKESRKKSNGRWNLIENKIFLEGFFKYRNNWKKLNEVIRTRNIIQLRSHAQKFLIRIQKHIKNFTNKNYVKGKIEEYFKKELNEKYNPHYLNNFTLYILKIFSINNCRNYTNNSRKNVKNSFENMENNLSMITNCKTKEDDLNNFSNNKNEQMNEENNLISSENNNNTNGNYNNIKKNNRSLYINNMSLNYINPRKKNDNEMENIQNKEEISNIINKETESPIIKLDSINDEFFPPIPPTYEENLFPTHINDNDFYFKFDESIDLNDWKKKSN